MNRRKLGTEYETRAAEYLTEQGFRVLERNFRCRTGEIDIIAKEGEYLCFVEVKYRSGRGCGSAFEAVDYRKQQKILMTARYYLCTKHYSLETPCRFDVVAIEGGSIELLRNAFGE